MERKGICVAGSIIVDQINEIVKYPNKGELAKIIRSKKSCGGLVSNVGIDLKRISPDLDVFACGIISADDNGLFAKKVYEMNNLDVSQVKILNTDQTSFTIVVSEVKGERTFFTYPGSSDSFGLDDIDLDNATYKILHLGYFMLIDKIDNGDGELILKKAKEKGIKTSIDLVTENSDRYKLVIPCLKYVDYLIVNEIEASRIAGIEFNGSNMEEIMNKLFSYGVREKVIVHMPKIGYIMSKDGFKSLPSFNYPKGYIKGTTGAGDAYCAGALYYIYLGKSDEEILSFASSSAAVSLSSADATSAMVTEKEILERVKEFKRLE